jgi:hypothetical protein
LRRNTLRHRRHHLLLTIGTGKDAMDGSMKNLPLYLVAFAAALVILAVP